MQRIADVIDVAGIHGVDLAIPVKVIVDGSRNFVPFRIKTDRFLPRPRTIILAVLLDFLNAYVVDVLGLFLKLAGTNHHLL